MSDTKILQSILDGQALIRADIKEVKEEVKSTKTSLTERMDKLGLQLASLEDDSPTIDEFDNLDRRVKRLENQAASA